MAEWLGLRTVNPVGICSLGFESHLRRFFIWFYGEINSNLEFEFCNPSSNIGKKLVSLKPHPPSSFKFRKKQNN